MGNLQINTTQNVNLDYKIVGLGERIVAFLIDGLILYMYAYLVSLISNAIGFIYEDTWTQRGLAALIFLPAMFYSLLMHSLFNGQTVGKMLMKMRVVRLDGAPVHWSNLLVRWMLRLVDIWIFLGSIGILSILFSDKRQRVGDAAAGTVVISTKRKTKVSHTILEEVEEAYEPQFTNVTLLTDKDVRLIKETYLIAKKSGDFKTLTALRIKVDSILKTNSNLYDVQYIDTVLKDYNYYTQKM
ncbi:MULTISPECIES: RDD family protein [Flagellimonas]|uniref:RDD family protein n=1 Tax=Flagellimonas hadalis TaxID=2597517 RepID=A0A5N5IRS4_9FLAO|nr:RDD family protein [Allomuricauda hadalis]KAB5485695.1 RDD family protein [Allomuricauda hadalis]RUA12436.1 MAG: RDD family protein [Flavobacteriia bacterium]